MWIVEVLSEPYIAALRISLFLLLRTSRLQLNHDLSSFTNVVGVGIS